MPLLEGTDRKRKARRNWRNGFLKITFRRYGAILAELDKEGVDEDVKKRSKCVYRLGVLHYQEGEWPEACERFKEASKFR